MGKWAQKAEQIETVEQDPGKKTGRWAAMAAAMDAQPEAVESRGESEWADVISSAVKNIPESAYSNYVEPLLSPIETAKSMGKLATETAGQGVGQMLTAAFPPDETQPDRPAPVESVTPHYDAMVNQLKERYTTIDGFKDAVSNDPVGVLSDVASLFMAGGFGLKSVGTASKLKPVAKAGEIATKVGARLEPVNVARQVSKPVGKLIPKGMPSRLWEGAAKLSTTLSKKDRDRIVKVAMKHEIPSTLKGIDKIDTLLNNWSAQADKLVAMAEKTGKKIPIDRLTKGWEKLYKDTLDLGEKAGDRALGALDDIIAGQTEKGRTALSADEAQKLKRRLYKELQTEYGKKRHTAINDVRILAARNAKEIVEELVSGAGGDIKGVNAKMSEVIDLHNAIERAAGRIANRDLMGIGVPIKGILGANVSGPAGATAGLGLGILDVPAVKSHIALLLNRLRNKGLKINPVSALARLGVVKAGQVSEDVQDQ